MDAGIGIHIRWYSYTYKKTDPRPQAPTRRKRGISTGLPQPTLPQKVVTQLQETGANESLHSRRGSLIRSEELGHLDISRERWDRGEGRAERCRDRGRDDTTRLAAARQGSHRRTRERGMRGDSRCRPGVGLAGETVRLERSLGRGPGEKRVPRG